MLLISGCSASLHRIYAYRFIPAEELNGQKTAYILRRTSQYLQKILYILEESNLVGDHIIHREQCVVGKIMDVEHAMESGVTNEVWRRPALRQLLLPSVAVRRHQT